MVVLLAAAAVGPSGVVLALAAQLPFVEHTAVSVQVALAPETEGPQQKTDKQTGVRLEFLICWREWSKRLAVEPFIYFNLFLFDRDLMKILVGYLVQIMHIQSFTMFSFVKMGKNMPRPHLLQVQWERTLTCWSFPTLLAEMTAVPI